MHTEYVSNNKTLTEFYDVKNKRKIILPMDRISKIRFKRREKNGKERISYALRGEWDNRNFTKFISKELWEGTDLPSQKDKASEVKKAGSRVKKSRKQVKKNINTYKSRSVIRARKRT